MSEWWETGPFIWVLWAFDDWSYSHRPQAYFLSEEEALAAQVPHDGTHVARHPLGVDPGWNLEAKRAAALDQCASGQCPHCYEEALRMDRDFEIAKEEAAERVREAERRARIRRRAERHSRRRLAKSTRRPSSQS